MLAVRFVAIQKTVQRRSNYHYGGSGFRNKQPDYKDSDYYRNQPKRDWRQECIDQMESDFDNVKVADDHEEAQPQDIDNAKWEDP